MPTGRALMMTLTGPTPAPFTGDRATAQQFVDEFNQLARANLRHLLIARPELRVELALQYINKNPTTIAWRRSARSQSRTSGLTDETVWDQFYDSFCTTWTDDPAPMPAATLPPPRPVPGGDRVVDLTDSDLAEWALSAPRTELTQTPPRSPHNPRSPTSLLDSVTPVDEPPRSTHTPVHPAPVPSVAAAATSRAEGPRTNDDDDATVSNNEEGSYKGSTPRLLPPGVAALPVASALVVEDDNSPGGEVKTLGTSVFTSDFTLSHPVVPVLPPQTPLYNIYDSPGRAMFAPIPRKRPREPDDTTDRDRTRRARHHLEHPPDSRLLKTARRIVATKHRNQHVWHRPRDHDRDTIRKSRVRHALTDEERRRYLTEGRTESSTPSYGSTVLTRRTDTEAQPRSPRYADIFPRHAFEQPRDPDEVAPATPLSGNQRRHHANAAATVPRPPPAASRNRVGPAARTSHQPDEGVTRSRDRPTRHRLRATAPVFTPRLPHAGSTQVHGVRLAMQIRTPAISHHFVRAATRIRDGHAYTARRTTEPTETQPASPRHHHASAAGTTPRTPAPDANPEATRNRDRQPHGSRSVPQPAATPVNVQPTRNRERPGTTAVDSAGIRAWLAQIVYEPQTRLDWRTAPSNRDPEANERADRVHRDYEYDDYCDSRREH
ncbi:hypothetical protein EDB85DRAFT_2147870 [Lactarius pseudohatsudake]|nr:hypothetical protein EDB85DRAFT_2147870 [Lactarius pseudohatsudake]